MAEALAIARVILWGQTVGALTEDADGVITFEYEPAFAASGIEISPLLLPLARLGPVQFPELRRIPAFAGLPGVLADALPDRFGNAVIAQYFADRGRPADAMSPVQKLLYIGHRAMGALEFEPAVVLPMRAAERESLELALLVEQARRLIEGRTDGALTEILRVGASAGGARAKALVLRNRVTDRVRSGFAAPGPGDEPWLVKFDGVGELGAPDFTARPFNRIEYAYGRLARDAGIEMPEAELLETQDGLAHFAVRRFDRVGERRLHMHSLGGLMHVDYDTPGTFSYEQYFRSVQSIVPPADVYASVENAFRRAVFNIAAVNQDDHVKNFGFLMDEQGAWRLSPAFDLTFARGTNYTRRHQMSLNGKRDDFARTDILAVGRRLRLARDGADTIDEVRAALARWPQYAAEAGVPKQRIGEIAAAHRQLAPVTG